MNADLQCTCCKHLHWFRLRKDTIPGLIFFVVVVAAMGLFFGSMLKILDNTDVFLTAEQCWHRANAFSTSHPTPPVRWLEVHKELGRSTPGQVTLNDQKDAIWHHPYHMASCSGTKIAMWGEVCESYWCLPTDWASVGWCRTIVYSSLVLFFLALG